MICTMPKMNNISNGLAAAKQPGKGCKVTPKESEVQTGKNPVKSQIVVNVREIANKNIAFFIHDRTTNNQLSEQVTGSQPCIKTNVVAQRNAAHRHKLHTNCHTSLWADEDLGWDLCSLRPLS